MFSCRHVVRGLSLLFFRSIKQSSGDVQVISTFAFSKRRQEESTLFLLSFLGGCRLSSLESALLRVESESSRRVCVKRVEGGIGSCEDVGCERVRGIGSNTELARRRVEGWRGVGGVELSCARLCRLVGLGALVWIGVGVCARERLSLEKEWLS